MTDLDEEEPIQAIIDAALKARADGYSSECILATLVSLVNAIAIVESDGDNSAGAKLFLKVHETLMEDRDDACKEDTLH